MNYIIGQSLCFEFSEHEARSGQCQIVTITKVGRRWLKISNGYRVDAKTLIADGGAYASPGRCFFSREERDKELARKKAWANLRKSLSWLAPDDVSAEDIERAARLLGLDRSRCSES